nr:NUDIX hydrolase [Pseudooceanicola sp. HF7]
MFQAAALCYRGRGADMEILLITSRETKRWIMPKGWPKTGTDAAGTALEEAWEEAGIKQRSMKPIWIGRYHYDKRLDGGLPAPTDVDVYAVEVARLLDDYPESGERERRWVRPEEAAKLVAEEDLKDLLRAAPELIAARIEGRQGH